MPVFVQSYGCLSAAGDGVAAFWRGLMEAKDFGREGVCRATWASAFPTAQDALLAAGLRAWEEAKRPLPDAWLSEPWGVILATTKGCVDDYIWNANAAAEDWFTPVLNSFNSASGLSPVRTLCVSNACASSHSAALLAKHWIETGVAKHVLVLAQDRIGRFVEAGFGSIKAITATKNRPFAAERDGLQLGDATAAIVFSSSRPTDLVLSGVAVESEGYGVTRPNPDGASLNRVSQAACGEFKPQVVVAHATGTRHNDVAEDAAILKAFGKTPWVTSTKWSVGHTLGASGAMDLIAACEILRTRKLFALANTPVADPSFGARYDLAGEGVQTLASLDTILVESLGFGGVQAAACLTRRCEERSDEAISTTESWNPAAREIASLRSQRQGSQSRIQQGTFDFQYPLTTPPEWEAKVGRWYQLDAPAYGLAQAYWQNRHEWPHPSWIVLASPSGSAETDRAFARSSSPAKFAHTLPGIRLSPLLEIAGWQVPSLCLQAGNSTWDRAMEEAEGLAASGQNPVWVLGVQKLKSGSDLGEGLYRVQWAMVERGLR